MSIDTAKDRGGANGLEAAGVAPAGQQQGGALRLGPGGKVNWNQSKLKGFVSVVLFGDATDGKQTLWVDDATVTLGPPARVLPVWPPPPPLPPADLTVLPPQAPWNPTPYAQWKHGPGQGEDYFPIAVWQVPKGRSHASPGQRPGSRSRPGWPRKPSRGGTTFRPQPTSGRETPDDAAPFAHAATVWPRAFGPPRWGWA